MKFRFFAAAALLLGLSVGCQQVELNSLSEIQISNKYVSIPQEGGSVSIDITATEEWKVDTTAFPKWLSVTPMQGGAGEGTITLSAEETEETNTADLKIFCAGKTQLLRVVQQAEIGEPEIITCAKAVSLIKANEQGTKTYYVKGIVCALIDISTQYGNATFWMSDNGVYDEKDGQNLQVYRSAWLNGGKITTGDEIAIGDEIVVCGCLIDYKGTPETQEKTTTVISITKSLIDVEPEELSVPKEGCDTNVVVKFKGDGLEVKPQVEWISLSGINVGTDSTIVTLHVNANEGDVREGTVVIKSSIPSQNSEKSVKFIQASGLDCYSLPYEETFQTGLGAWTVSDVKSLPEGNVWFFDSANKCAKATGYVNSTNNETESDLVSPRIDLTSATAASLTFEHAARYGANLDDEFTLWVSKDNGETYSQILIPVYTDKANWNWYSNTVSLTPYVGNQVIIKFKYKSYTTGGPTAEIRNVSIKAEEVTITNIAQLNSATGSEKEFEVTLTDAVVVYVNGGNAFIQDKTAGIQLYKSDHGFTAGQVINGAVKVKTKIYNGYAEATSIDVTSATVTSGEAPVPTVKTIAELYKAYLRWQNCLVKVEGVTFETAITTSNRNGVIKQADDEIAVYAQVKNTLEMNGTGALVCLPTRYYNSSTGVTTLQLGVFSNDDWTPAN